MNLPFQSVLFLCCLISQVALAVPIEMRELRVYQKNDGPLEYDDEVYVLVSVSRADGSATSYSVPMGGQWSMSPSGRSVVGSTPLFGEPLYPGQRTRVTLTLMESDGDSPAYGQSIGQDVANWVAFRMRTSPTMDYTQLGVEVRSRTHRFDDDDVLGQVFVELWNDGATVRSQVIGVDSAVVVGGDPYMSILRLRGDGADYQMILGVNPYL